MSIDEAAFDRDLKNLSKADLLKKYPSARIHPDVEALNDVIAGEMGKDRAENGMRFEALEAEVAALRDERRAFVRKLQELENQIEDTVSYQGAITDVQTQVRAMQVENDLVLKALRSDDKITVTDSVRALRSVR